jgi:phosphoglucomutase
LIMELSVTSSPFIKKYKIPAMGTSGVRLVQEIYNQPGFLEQFIQGIAEYFIQHKEEFRKSRNNLIILGGDPRLGNEKRIHTAAAIFAGNGFNVRIASVDGKLTGVASTPAMSHAIRQSQALAGIVFTASHNPFTDVGIKVNIHDGSPALEDTADAIHKIQNQDNLTHFKSSDFEQALHSGVIAPIDTVKLYADLLESIFDFEEMKKTLLKLKSEGKFNILIDGMGGAAGPYIKEIFQKRLSAEPELLRCDPDPYLGGPNDPSHPNHPEPDFGYIPDLLSKNATGNYQLAAAFDSDVDRRLDGGDGFWIESDDEFALFAAHSDLIGIDDLFRRTGNAGGTDIVFARSAVTAPAIDLMYDDLKKKFSKENQGIMVLETATGFKWIAEYGNWGVEESNGLGNPWLREKDGIFSTIFLLKLMLHTGKSVKQLMEDEIWKKYGRVYFSRGEISAVPKLKPTDPAYSNELEGIESEKKSLQNLLDQFSGANPWIGKSFNGYIFEKGENWNYIDPKGNIRSKNAAYILHFSNGLTAKMRFSGTGSGGYTLRIYLTKHDLKFSIPKKQMLESGKKAAAELFLAAGFSNAPGHYNDSEQPEVYI